MRVAINGWFLDQSHTGSGQYTHRLLFHLLEAAPEHAYVLVTPEGVQPVTRQRLIRASPPVNRRPGLRKVWFEQIAFPRACRRIGADIAHVPYWGSPWQPTVPTLVTIHDLIPLLLPEYHGNILVRAYTRLVQKTAPQAALVLTDSEASQRDIVAHLHLAEEKVRAIYLAAESAPASAPSIAGEDVDAQDAAIRAAYDLPDAYVLYLGGFDVRKNLVGLLRAWAIVQGALETSQPLVIAGRLPKHSDFTPDPRQVAQTLGLDPGMLVFPGYIEEAHKPALYRRAVCFVFPSRYEGFGLPPLEALHHGVPVIGSNVSAIPEVVGQAGMLVAPDDVSGMAKALIAVMTDAGLRARLSARALAQAARFSWTKTVKETLAAYEEVLL